MTRRTASGSSATLCPATMALPEVTGMSVVIMRISVLLPAPFGPSRPKISPSATLKLTLLTAFKIAVALADVLDSDGNRPCGAVAVRRILIDGRAHCFTNLALGM